MLKSHFTYTCTTYLGNIKSAREESERLWIMPFLGQLTDDCRDFYDDITSNSVTSYTHYASFIGRQQPSDKHLLNPFYAFLYLCTDLYISSDCDIQTGAFLGRRIVRTLRSIEKSAGESALREFLYIFCQDNTLLHDYCWIDMRNQFPYVSDPEKAFFRAVHKASIQYARTNRKLETYAGDHLQQIEDSLKIHSFYKNKALSISDRDEKLLLSAMNYSVKAGGKRLRPLMMMMVSDLYKIDLKNVLPLACGIEYLHTSSLIFDDLPAQDNSDLRRGRPTLHKAIIDGDIPENLCEGRAQLAAVDLIAVSMSLINHDLVKNGFSSEHVNRVVSEISLSMHDLCIGQMMDLRAARMGIEQGNGQLDELDRIAWLKTGKAIEIVLVTPAMLTMSLSENIQSVEIIRIRELGRLMGILFQMRDDLLDVEGENIGKPAALDVKNNTVTYVSILGVEGTRQRLKEFRRQTLKLVDECWPVGAGTIKDVVNYIVDRKN
jgi:geranylgeranyl pyrophosphate synthase